ncbi:hypothetical protein G4V62_10855 [Bacillaceae bacterium SIJ1]|uniref:ABC transporter permease n=1 Tax=Litoribacterium kuwaitense TaxID=1398745 RepID=UPI0013EA7305|nr:ABC transporter permease [Litoribacterium kuwaitense]NGP45431.1 hypothetical protein [Litoribacterium kuwaitense]
MLARDLYIKRRSVWRKEQKTLIRSMVDWVIALYLIIPAIVAMSFGWVNMYISPPAALTNLPLWVFALLFALLAWPTSFRSYFADADALFIARQQGILQQLLDIGTRRMVYFEFVRLLAIWFILLPLWHFQPLPNLAFLLSFLLSFKVYRMAWSGQTRTWRWIGLIFFVPLLLLLFTGWIWVATAIVLLVGIIISRRDLTVTVEKLGYNHWLDIENRLATRFVRLIFWGAKNAFSESLRPPKPSKVLSRIPLHNMRANTPHGLLFIVFTRWLLRHIHLILPVLVILGLGFIGTLISPMWIAIVLTIAVTLIVAQYIHSLWSYFFSQSFLQLFPWPAEVKMPAHDRVITPIVSFVFIVMAGGVVVRLLL